MMLPLLLVCALSAAEAPSWSATLQAAVAKPVITDGIVQEEVGAYVRARVPKPALPADAAAWDTEQERLRGEFLEKLVYRGVPESWQKGEVRVEWGGVLKPAAEYEIRKLRYEALPGHWIPAIVYVPAGLAGKTVAVLNVNGHVGPPGKSYEEEQLRCINQAKRGIIAFHPEWLSFGELQGDGYSHNRLAYLDLVGTSGLSVFYLALKRAVDVLETMPEVDPARIGMTGLSGGGWQTILFSALDKRIAAAVPNAGYIGIDVRTGIPGDIGDLEQVPADMLKMGDYTHLTAMLAPRPALIILNAKDECCFEAGHTAPVVYDAHLPWYALYGAEASFHLHVNQDPGTHNYGKDNRQVFYGFVKSHLMPEAAWETEDLAVEAELQTQEALNMGLPPMNEDFITLATALFGQQPKPAIPAADAPEFAAWQETQRQGLREVLALEDLGAEAETVEQTEEAGLRMQSLRVKSGGAWTVPALRVSLTESSSKSMMISLADEGYQKEPALLEALVQEHGQVIAADLTFLGQAKPSGNSYQYSMLLNATGARALGVQVAEVLALADWAKAQGAEGISLHARGWNASTAALMASALDPELKVVSHDAPETLFRLVQDKIHYNEKTPLFVFGLLPQFDVPVLLALSR